MNLDGCTTLTKSFVGFLGFFTNSNCVLCPYTLSVNVLSSEKLRYNNFLHFSSAILSILRVLSEKDIYLKLDGKIGVVDVDLFYRPDRLLMPYYDPSIRTLDQWGDS